MRGHGRTGRRKREGRGQGEERKVSEDWKRKGNGWRRNIGGHWTDGGEEMRDKGRRWR